MQSHSEATAPRTDPFVKRPLPCRGGPDLCISRPPCLSRGTLGTTRPVLLGGLAREDQIPPVRGPRAPTILVPNFWTLYELSLRACRGMR